MYRYFRFIMKKERGMVYSIDISQRNSVFLKPLVIPTR